MKSRLSPMTNFIREEEGASAIEYAILASAIAAMIVAITVIVGYQVENLYDKLCQAMKAINNNACA